MMHNLHANINGLNKHRMHAGLLLHLPCRPRIRTHTRAVSLRWLKEAVDLESSVSVATNTVGAKQSSAMDIPKIRSGRRLLVPSVVTLLLVFLGLAFRKEESLGPKRLRHRSHIAK